MHETKFIFVGHPVVSLNTNRRVTSTAIKKSKTRKVRLGIILVLVKHYRQSETQGVNNFYQKWKLVVSS